MNVSAYDFNGNILGLTRKDANGTDMDNLQYTYGNSNQLQKVKDHSGNEEGFKDSSVDDTDYIYDDNGNMISDDNKEIASIKYNYLNLPDTVLFNDGKQLVFVYDATGTKLQQHTIDGATVKTTDYFGALYLENDTLQFIHTAEGRVVLKDGDPIYEYYILDHLGNVRTTFTTKPEKEVFETSFETVEQPLFDNYAEQNRDVSYAKTGAYSSRLSSEDNRLIGLAKSLKVYAGDTVNATAYVRELAGTTGNVNNLFTLLAQGFAGAFANTPLGLEGNLNSFSEALYPALGTGGLMDKDDNDATPKLYLNMLYFDKDMNFVTASFARSTQAATTSFEHLNLEFLAPMEGYLLIYVSNEEEQANIAYFDDLNVTHKHSKVVQEESYFPFGSSHSVSYQRNYTKRQGFKYQNKEEMVGLGEGIFDFHARMYDADLGRTFQKDPHAYNYLNLSPYSWVANNPLIFTDPTGMDIELGNLYEKDDEGNYKYETSIRAFEAFAATKIGREWIGSRAQEGFKIDFAFEKGGISIAEAGNISSVVDYNFEVGDAKGGLALTEYSTDGQKLKVDITFDESSSELKNPDAYSFMQMGEAVFHETNFHGFTAERRYGKGEKNPKNLSTGNHKQSDLSNSPFGAKGYSYYLYLVNKESTKKMAGYEKYSKYTKHSEETYGFWWYEFMGQFTR